MAEIKKPRVKRFNLRQHKVTRLQVVALVSLVVLVGAAVVYKSFAGSNAGYVPKGIPNLAKIGRAGQAVRVNPSATGGYVMDTQGSFYAFGIGTSTSGIPYALPGSYSGGPARDFVVLSWSGAPSVLVLSKDGRLQGVGANDLKIKQQPFTTTTARKIIMYDAKRGYVLDGAGNFIPFSLYGADLPLTISGQRIRAGEDYYRSAVINPATKKNGYLVSSNGNVYEFRVGSNAVAPAVSAGTTWEGVDKAIDITLSDWNSRQGYVIASDGGWYAFNGAPNDYIKKSGAPFNFGTNVRGFDRATKAGFEVAKDGTVSVFSLPNFLVAQNNKEITPPPTKKAFKPEGPLANGYYRMPVAPNGEYSFYNYTQAPFNRVTDTWDKTGTSSDDRCGSLALVNMTYKVAVQWQTKYGKDGSRLVVGDLNAAGHKSHDEGVDVDIRTSDLSAAYAPAARGNTTLQNRSIQLGEWLVASGAKRIFYNDTTVQAAVNKYARDNKFANYDVMQSLDGHHDHMHVRIGSRYSPGNPLALAVSLNGCP